MTLIYLLAAILALAVYALTSKLGIITRVVIALLIFLIPAVLATVWIFMIGDKASPDAVTVQQNGEIQLSTDKKHP